METYHLKRVLEPELMDDAEQVAAYAQADFSDSNQWYVDHLTEDFSPRLRSVIDLGCGPADVAVRLARGKPDIHVTAVDGSSEMLEHARRAVMEAGVEKQVSPFHGYVPKLPLEDHSFDAILSKDFLHHLPDPMTLWNEAKRLGKPGAIIYVMDLIRPVTLDEARSIVERVAANEHPVLKQDFFNSLCAAFTLDEVRLQIAAAGLDLEVIQATERHLLVRGAL